MAESTMTTSNLNNQQPSTFVSYLAKICEASGPRARLRRTLGRDPADAHQAHAFVAPFLGDKPTVHRERAMYSVAALFAHTNGSAVRDRTSFGAWLGHSIRQGWETDSFKLSRTSIERRLYRLNRLSSRQVQRELPLLMAAAKIDNPTLDWDQLIIDLTYWDDDRSIAKRWLQGFHRAIGVSDVEDKAADPAT